MPVVTAAAERYSARMHVVSGAPEERPRPDCVAYVFDFLARIITCRVYKLTLSDQAKVAQQLRISFSELVLRLVAAPPLQGRPQHLIFFYRGPNPLSAAPMI
jgi:hypothetical protein